MLTERRCVVGAMALLTLLATAGQADARPRFYFDVRGVKLPPKASASLKEKAKELLIAELKKQPSVVLELGDPRPSGAGLEQALKSRRLTGYGLVVRVTKAETTLQPPAPGKVFRVLSGEVDVAIDAEKVPSGQMALAGEGNAQVGTEVKQVKDKERTEILQEALAEAIKQAVVKSITRLAAPPKPEKPVRRKKR
jgi:hypothetical protein